MTNFNKQPIKFYSNPADDPSFEKTQRDWYRKIAELGFIDLEDHTRKDRPLIKWSGVSFPLRQITVTEHPFSQEEDLLNHPEFNYFCEGICRHGNHTLKSIQVRQIWIGYIAGQSCRAIAKDLSINHCLVFRVEKKLTELMNLIESKEDVMEDPKDASTVVLRPYDPVRDAPFVFASWRNNLWFDEKRDDHDSDKFYAMASKAIKKILSRPDSQVRIACLNENPDQIIGYAVLDGSQIEWVYVKSDYRKMGIGSLLVKGFKSFVEPMTKLGKKIAAIYEQEQIAKNN